jgi:hypothetical protein
MGARVDPLVRWFGPSVETTIRAAAVLTPAQRPVDPIGTLVGSPVDSLIRLLRWSLSPRFACPENSHADHCLPWFADPADRQCAAARFSADSYY